MSHQINDSLLERAAEMRSYFEGTDLETAIDSLISRNDLEQLQHLVSEAEYEAAQQEYYNYDL